MPSCWGPPDCSASWWWVFLRGGHRKGGNIPGLPGGSRSVHSFGKGQRGGLKPRGRESLRPSRQQRAAGPAPDPGQEWLAEGQGGPAGAQASPRVCLPPHPSTRSGPLARETWGQPLTAVPVLGRSPQWGRGSQGSSEGRQSRGSCGSHLGRHHSPAPTGRPGLSVQGPEQLPEHQGVSFYLQEVGPPLQGLSVGHCGTSPLGAPCGGPASRGPAGPTELALAFIPCETVF